MTHIADLADENTQKLDGDGPITVGTVIDALSRFPREAGVMITFIDGGEFVGAVGHVDGVIGNNYTPDKSTMVGLLLNIGVDPLNANDYFAPGDDEPTEAPNGFTPAS